MSMREIIFKLGAHELVKWVKLVSPGGNTSSVYSESETAYESASGPDCEMCPRNCYEEIAP